jgi:hypothetical protein
MRLVNKVPFLFLIPIAVLIYFVHLQILYFIGVNPQQFFYPLEIEYSCFALATALIVFVLQKIKQKNFDTVGLAFLWITSIKMTVCFFAVRPILQIQSPTAAIEKINFFVIFIVFLAIETALTISFLNEKKGILKNDSKDTQK